MNYNPTDDQERALQQLIAWFKQPTKQYITLGGYAGTGKTTLLGFFRHRLRRENPNLRVAFCAFTGKASQVLQQNLHEQNASFSPDRVSTIHSLIYEVRSDKNSYAVHWEKRYAIDTDLIIVDEASMVSETLWHDLLSFGIPIIAVGDHGQLPPVGESFSLMVSPTLKLEQIHRQAAKSPIIQLSQSARETGKIAIGRYGKNIIKYDRKDTDIGNIVQNLLESWNEDVLFLVGMNWTRAKLNKQIRILRELPSTPSIGDRVICLKNNWQEGIYNGLLGSIMHIKPEHDNRGDHHWYVTDIALDDGRVYRGRISKHQFESSTTINQVEGLRYTDIGDLFDFGYALTVHKAQGSQAKRVIVFEERNKHMDDEQWRRWLYTAVTRAEKELILIGD